MERAQRNANHEEKRLQIIEAFYLCAARDGLRKATNRSIASEANVPLGILHYYFKDRAEMIESLVKWVADVNTLKYRMAIKNINSAEAVFHKAFEFLFVTMMDDSAGSLMYDLWSEAKRNNEIKNSFSYMYATYRELIVEQISDITMLSVTEKKELHSLASLLIAMNEGILLQWDIDRDHVDPNEVSRVAAEIILAYFKSKKDAQPE